MLEQLTAELLEEIFSHASIDDLKNVSCCSRACHRSLKHLLWKNVVLHYLDCDISHDLLDNLKYTERLRFCGSTEDAHEMFSYGFHFARILQHCNPSKVKAMMFSDMATEGVTYALKRFNNITDLKLISIHYQNWDCLGVLRELQKLRLTECNVSDAVIRDVVNVKELRTLALVCCSSISNSVIQHVSSHAVNLTEFTFDNNGSDNDVFDFGLLANLRQLRSLSIYSSAILDASLVLLCQSLTNLVELSLCYSKFSDEGLSQIHTVMTLEKLDLTDCPFLSSKCMTYVRNIPCLRKIWLSGTICSSDHGSYDNLNDIPTLREIHVMGKRDKDEKKVTAILRDLCGTYKWKLKIEQDDDFDDDFDRYTLRLC